MSLLSRLIREEPEDRGSGGVAVESLEDVFEEEPVPLDVFVRDRQFMNSPELGPVQFAAVRYAERIYYPDLYPRMAEAFGSAYWAEPIRMVNFIDLEWGKGSGKDHICRVASLRIAYLLLCLRKPQRYYELPTQDTIHMLNIASSAPQAYQAFFAPITKVVKNGWFASHCEPKQNVISYAKNVECISGNSDAETQEGLNLILGIADEIDAFRSKSELARYHGASLREPVKSAEAILDLLQSSAESRFPETFKNIRISYPRYLGSKIQQLTAEGKADNEKRGTHVGEDSSRHYVDGPRTTWDVNPRYDKYPRVTIPQTEVAVPNVAAIVRGYEKDPVLSRAKYECRPDRAIDTYFKNMEAVRACVTEARQPLEVEYKLVRRRSEVTGKTVEGWDPEYTWLPEGPDVRELRPIAGALYAMHADLAVTGDRAGVAMSHVVRWETVSTTVQDGEGFDSQATTMRPVVKTDFVIAYSADVSTKPVREIQIRWARELAYELIKRGFAIVSFTYDGFQSVDSIQILESHGVESERLSMDMKEDPWKNWRDLISDARWQTPYSFDLIDEVGALGRVRGKIDHPPGGSKDLADAVCGSVVGAIVAGGEEDPDGTQSYYDEGHVDVGSAVPLGHEPRRPATFLTAWGPMEADSWGEGSEPAYGMGLPEGMEGVRL